MGCCGGGGSSASQSAARSSGPLLNQGAQMAETATAAGRSLQVPAGHVALRYLGRNMARHSWEVPGGKRYVFSAVQHPQNSDQYRVQIVSSEDANWLLQQIIHGKRQFELVSAGVALSPATSVEGQPTKPVEPVEPVEPVGPTEEELAALAALGGPEQIAGSQAEVDATKPAREYAVQHGIALAEVEPEREDGKITLGDVRKHHLGDNGNDDDDDEE